MPPQRSRIGVKITTPTLPRTSKEHPKDHQNWQQTFHFVVMTESGEKLKLVGG